MKAVEIVFNSLFLKFGFWPLILTLLMVLIVIIITFLLVRKELRKK